MSQKPCSAPSTSPSPSARCTQYAHDTRDHFATVGRCRPGSNNELNGILTMMRPLFEECWRREERKKSGNSEEEAFWLTAEVRVIRLLITLRRLT